MSSTRLVVRLSALAIASVMLAPAAAEAQSLTAGTRARPVVITQEDLLDAEARGEGFAQSGQFVEARRAYREAVSLRQRVKEAPVNAQWQIAHAFYAEGDLHRAALTLDELAADAARRGDHDVRAKAMLESAFLHRAAGDRRRSSEIARALRDLSARAPIDAALREEIAARLR